MCVDYVTALILMDHKGFDALKKGDVYGTLMATSSWFYYYHRV